MAAISIDNGMHTCTGQEALEHVSWDVIVSFMDDDVRERVHEACAPCTNEEFMRRYLEVAPCDLKIG
jgi:hypothetical protein